MEKEFIPYEQALALKELGFDEPCLGYYTGDKMHFVLRPLMLRANELESHVATAPLYQQAFRWFREKHGLIGWIEGKQMYAYRIESTISTDDQLNKYPFRKYEVAELECLITLIKILKNK